MLDHDENGLRRCGSRRLWLKAVLVIAAMLVAPFAYYSTLGSNNFADPSALTAISHHYSLNQMREFAFKNSIASDHKSIYYTKWSFSYSRLLEEADNRFDVRADDVIVFLHIQKTAGTSFERFLVRHLDIDSPCICKMGKKRCSCFRPNAPNRIWLFSRYSTGWMCGLHADFTELSVSGCVDHAMDKKEGVHRKRRYYYTTFLREPIARFISEYRHVERGATWLASRHMCNGRPPTPDQLPMCFDPEQGWEGVTLDEFLSCPYNLAFNRQTRMLADLTLVNCYDTRGMDPTTRDRIILESAKSNLKNLAYYGIKERMFDSQWMFEQVFQLRFTRRLDDWAKSKSNGTAITEAQLSLIRQRNQLDIQLYDYAVKLFDRRLRKLRDGADGPHGSSRRLADASRQRLAKLNGEAAWNVDVTKLEEDYSDALDDGDASIVATMSGRAGDCSPSGIADIAASFDDAKEALVRQALSSGTDLKEYSAKVEADLQTAHRQAVRNCIDQADTIVQLHEEIVACDNVFAGMEKMLLGFQTDLASISGDMRRLQHQSVEINQQLQNRQLVRAQLSQFVDDLVVTQTMIQAIMDRDVSEREFLEQLHELQHKLQFIKAQEFKDAKATADVHDVMENLKFKAMEKIREWLLMKISLFRKPLTNYQIPQNALLKHRFFYEFLLANDRQVAREVRDEYVDSISKMFYSYFKTYASRLFKLQMSDSASKDDLLGAEDTVKTPGFFSSKPQVRNRATVFSLGTRNAILSVDLSAPLIVPHAAQQANEKFQFEMLFRSLQYALVDHSSHEYLFVCDFFLITEQTAIDLFGQVMGRAIANLQKTIDDHIAVNYDAISLYLCLRMCAKYAALMVERGVPAMNSYWETTTNALWTRLDVIMQAHNDSVRLADVKRLAPIDTRPHYIIRRYAEFTCAFLVASELPDEPLDGRMQRLLTKQQSEIEQLLARMSGQFANNKERLVCLINNYDLILTTISERVSGDTREKTSFWELQQTASARYVDEVLTPYFGQLIAFVNECEPLIEQGHTQLLQRSAAKVTTLVRSFGADWKKSLDQINKEIVRSFTNFKNGTSILQTAFTQLIQYHQRFQKVLAHEAFADCPVRNELVNIHHIMVELKKYKPVY